MRRASPLLAFALAACGVSSLELSSREERFAVLSPDAKDASVPPGEVIDVDAGRGGGGNDEPFADSGMGGGGHEEPLRDAGTFDAGRPECTPGMTRACTTSCGSTGVQRCGASGWTASCEVPREACSNGRDDDCDGATDARDRDCPPIVVRCETTEGNSCNGDLGYGDHCASSDNTGGCSAERFANWCNRRNPATPDRWDDYIANWVDSRCDGALVADGNTFRCVSSSNVQYECTTPLVLVFDGDAVKLEQGDSSFAFTPGEPVRSDWPSAATPWLARDVNGNGRIDDGSELFGSSTRLAPGVTAAHGFAALAPLDENHDGAVDARDPAFASLVLWRDRDGDRVSQPGELEPLAARVASLPVAYELDVRCDPRGNCQRERATFTARDGHRGVLVDVYLRTTAALRACLVTRRR